MEDEARLLEQARKGDGEAFDRLVTRHFPGIHALLARLAGEDAAEDLAQECFLRAWRALPAFRGRAAFQTWLHRIALNLARSEGRSRKRRREVEVPAAALARHDAGNEEGAEMDCEGLASPAIETLPGAEAEREERAEMVRQALAALEHEGREVVVLRDIEGLDYDEIAELVGASREAVKSRLHRARGMLSAELRRLGCEL